MKLKKYLSFMVDRYHLIPIEELMKQPDIDGVLVGGASLKIKTYSKIIELVRGDLS